MLQHQGLVLTITVLTFVLNVYLYILVPKGFFPQQDTGRIGGQVRGQQDVSFPEMKKKVLALAAIVGKDPGVEDVMAFAGGRRRTAATRAIMFMSLKPDAERQKTGDTAEVIVNRLRPKVSGIPGASSICSRIRSCGSADGISATQYQYTLTADNLKDLNEWAPKLMDGDGEAAGDQGCGDGPAAAGSAGATGDRPRYGEPAGRFAAGDRCDAVGCVWADAGFDDVSCR